MLNVPLVRDNVKALIRPALYVFIFVLIIWRKKIRRLFNNQNKFHILDAELIDITAYIEDKAAVAFEYRSQMPVLFVSRDAFLDTVKRYSNRVSGNEDKIRFVERYWRRRPDVKYRDTIR